MTPLERLNDQGAVLNLFIWLLVGSFVGTLIGLGLKANASWEEFLHLVVVFVPFVWVPSGAILATVGVALFIRAGKIAASGDEGR
ncbi:hypothetical protein [Leucobacter aridicollis]|uniref:hypothetical protein n=1 Tax=Leucobacter aridicollis TaxID=283878 RepID=UPI002103320D|nr:hypothetical protein [Leucobacter aridicollis]UTX53757.1 hypothetical protein KI794_03205 [Leucobacter aridicollis]